MDYRLLDSFLVLADLLHFGQAAKKLNMSQPCLSNQIARLESDLGGALFDRTKTRVRLTEAGRMLQAEAKKLRADSERLRFRLQSFFKNEEGVLSLGYGDVTELKRLSRAILKMHELYPRIRFHLCELDPGETVERVQNGSLDASVVTGTPNETFPPDLQPIKIMEGRLRAALPANHPLAKQEKLTLEDLQSEKIIACTPRQSDEMQDMEQVKSSWVRENLLSSSDVILDVRRRTTAYWMVSSGLGVAILPNCYELIPSMDPTLSSAVTNVVFKDVEGLNIASWTWFVTLKNRNDSLISRLTECVLDTFNTHEL